MDIVMKLMSLEFMKGWRTTTIVLIVAACVISEQLLGLDIPKATFTWDDLLIALGLKAAAAHEPA